MSLSVLVIDDERDFRDFVVRSLRREYSVEPSPSASDALSREDFPLFDIYLIDVFLPDGNGLDILKEIKSRREGRARQVILVTGSVDRSLLTRCIESGADDFIRKPVDALEVSLRVKAAAIRLGIQRDMIGECEYFRQAVKKEEELSSQLLDRHLSLKETLLAVNAVKKTLERANKRLENVANRDALTGLLNRASVLAKADMELSQARESGSPLALLMIDLDYFKTINDEHGHIAGDQCLKALGTCLKNLMRRDDWIGRYGGEEFIAVLPSANIGRAVEIAERIRRAVSSMKVRLDADREIGMTVSVGVASMRQGEELLDFIGRADASLYRAKADGRDRVCVAD